MANRATIVSSCPGKVLAAGGYVVLEKPNTGLVVATSSRFYAAATDLQAEPQPNTVQIRVESPQFLNAQWDYTLFWDVGAGLWTINTHERQGRNPFVQAALHTVVSYLSAHHREPFLSRNASGCRIVVLGDNDFYTQPTPDAPPFASLQCPLRDVHKTGLGSSAAMTTSLVSALLHYLDPLGGSPETGESRELLHNLAQFAHAAAQGKVGSGFDVSSAVYGTHQYVRFAPSCLQDLLDHPLAEVRPMRLYEVLSPTQNPSWSDPSQAAQVHPLTLPPFTTMLLADVDAGSNTPSMVSAVLKWREADPEAATRVWDVLVQNNQELARLFERLNALWRSDPDAYRTQIQALQSEPVSQTAAGSNSVAKQLSAVKDCMQFLRKSMKTMGEAAGVGIEPDEQTHLLDACCALPGVIGAGVPGAGGLDAVWVLVIELPGRASCVAGVEQLWRSWTATKVTALSASSRASGPGAPHHGTAVSAEAGVQTELLQQAKGPIVERLKALGIML